MRGWRSRLFRFQLPRGGAGCFGMGGFGVCVSTPAPAVRQMPSLTLRRQDYGKLGINRSIMDTPLGIGQRAFERGLGTHANSEIAIGFPVRSVKAFKALAGIDSNRGTLGTVEFQVEIGGTNLFHSRKMRGGDEAIPVEVKIPASADQLVLKVDTTPDGPSSDHADWAAAQLVMSDGSLLWLDELAWHSQGDFWSAHRTPFSFVYGGESSDTFLAGWRREVVTNNFADRVTYVSQWDDPKTGLKVRADATLFRDFPAVEWLLRFENTGMNDSPILENVQVLDAALNTGPGQNLLLDQIAGDDASEHSFVPMERELAPGQTVALAPQVEDRPAGRFRCLICASAGGEFSRRSAGRGNGLPRFSAAATARPGSRPAWS